MRIEGLRAGGTAPFSVTHDLTLSVEELQAVASRHTGEVEQHAADLPVVLPSGRRTVLQQPAADTVTNLEGIGAWLTMFGVQHDPALKQIALELPSHLAGAGHAESTFTLSLVCSSPDGVTPAHVDAHDVLLLQLHGSKALGTGTFTRRRDHELELRRRFGPRRENLSRLPDRQQHWALGPGRGVFIPAYTPHWAEVGSSSSVALSIGISSPALRKRETAHRADAALLRHGIRLPAPGRFAPLDAVRAGGVAATRGLRRA